MWPCRTCEHFGPRGRMAERLLHLWAIDPECTRRTSDPICLQGSEAAGQRLMGQVGLKGGALLTSQPLAAPSSPSLTCSPWLPQARWAHGRPAGSSGCAQGSLHGLWGQLGGTRPQPRSLCLSPKPRWTGLSSQGLVCWRAVAGSGKLPAP